MNSLELLSVFLLILLLVVLGSAPWLWLMYRQQKISMRLQVRNSQAYLTQSKALIKDLTETIQIQAELANQTQNQAMNLLSAKEPMTFQALSVTQPNPSQDSSDLVREDNPAQDDVDTIIRVKGHLTPDEADYFRNVEGIEISDSIIRY